MPTVKLGQLQEGMVASEDIKNMDDMLLLPAGCTLTEKHIRILHAWGVAQIQVEAGDEVATDADEAVDLNSDRARQLADELRQRFWGFDPANSVQQEVLKLVLLRKLRSHVPS